MAFSINDLIQTAAEDLNQVGDGEPVSGELAASYEGLVNRAIAELNADSYISLTVGYKEIMAAGSVFFKELEPGESPSNTINMYPPDTISGVSRKVGLRFVPLRGFDAQTLDRANTFSLPTIWNYGTTFETAPSGKTRPVGVLRLNGTSPVELRIYLNSTLPRYRLGDTIYLSNLYYNLILYATELKAIDKYKLFSYSASAERGFAKATKLIDTNTANNRPLGTESAGPVGSPLDTYYDLLGGTFGA